MAIFPSPRPEIELALFGEPPLMLTAMEFVPAPELAPEARSVPESPVTFGVASGKPPGAPGFFPSGEMATRAARFPGGWRDGCWRPGRGGKRDQGLPRTVGGSQLRSGYLRSGIGCAILLSLRDTRSGCSVDLQFRAFG